MENKQITKSNFNYSNSLNLAVETSGRIGSVAIGCREKILGQRTFSGPMTHSIELFPALNSILENIGKKPSDIHQIYISIGPGSFTGLRIAVTIAKSMFLANKVKIVPVNTLDIIAQNTMHFENDLKKDLSNIAVILDAKRSHFFAASYTKKGGYWERKTPDSLTTAPDFLDRFAEIKPLWLIGEGLQYHRNAFQTPNIQFVNEKYWTANAENLYNLGWEKAKTGHFADPFTLKPNYMCRPEAEIKWKQRNNKG